MPDMYLLKLCPFCGGDDLTMVEQPFGDAHYFIMCLNPACSAYGPDASSEAEAVKAWNTRSAAAPRTRRSIAA